MADKDSKKALATETRSATAVLPEAAKPKALPPYKVLLHNDDHNTVEFVVQTIVMLTPLPQADAWSRTEEAHHTGTALLLVTHKERAELYAEQFMSRGLTVTIEADE